MLELQRIPVGRQRVSALALAEYFKTQKPELTAKVQASCKRVIKAGEALHVEAEGPPMPVVDHTVDAVISAFHRGVNERAYTIDATLIKPGPKQTAVTEAARLVLDRVFPDGIKVIQYRYSLQWDALHQSRAALATPEVKKAIATLGLEADVEHVLAHIDLYGKTLGISNPAAAASPSDAETAASDEFHQAYVQFAIDVMSDVKDAAVREALLGSYRRQLAEHQSESRDERKKRKKAPGGSPA